MFPKYANENYDNFFININGEFWGNLQKKDFDSSKSDASKLDFMDKYEEEHILKHLFENDTSNVAYLDRIFMGKTEKYCFKEKQLTYTWG
jgi:hypothetical protein